MSRGVGSSWRDAAQPGTNEPDDIEYERLRCQCGAFLAWKPTLTGDSFMAWTCRRCTHTLVEQDPPAGAIEGTPF